MAPRENTAQYMHMRCPSDPAKTSTSTRLPPVSLEEDEYLDSEYIEMTTPMHRAVSASTLIDGEYMNMSGHTTLSNPTSAFSSPTKVHIPVRKCSTLKPAPLPKPTPNQIGPASQVKFSPTVKKPVSSLTTRNPAVLPKPTVAKSTGGVDLPSFLAGNTARDAVFV